MKSQATEPDDPTPAFGAPFPSLCILARVIHFDAPVITLEYALCPTSIWSSMPSLEDARAPIYVTC
jgi:hypothetical protein